MLQALKLFRAEVHTSKIIKAVQDALLAYQELPPLAEYAVTLPSRHREGASQAARRAHVPPVATPTQTEYVNPHSIKSRRKCAWAPFCKYTIDVCGGAKKHHRCKDHAKHSNSHTDDELQLAK
eukprot:scaffold225704_cov32-Attheya_sp.AAC.1